MEKKKYYPDVNPNPSFPKLEGETLKFWEKDGTFQKSIDNRAKAKPFIFYDGPPFANGLPHYGHLLTGYVKDVFARYQTMLGRKVERRFGWDCHGLPAEMGAEKELGINGRAAIMRHGIERFNDKCRADVMKYSGEWEKYVNRQARWVDFKHDYKTMDKSFMESVMWAFKQLWDKGLVYEAMRVMPYSWAAETPLSNFETRLDNSYRERADKAVTVAFKIKNHSAYLREKFTRKTSQPTYLLAWTTTPWTLPSNLALAVKPDLTYVILDTPKGQFIASLDWFSKNFNWYKELTNIFEEKLSEKDIDNLKSGEPVYHYYQTSSTPKGKGDAIAIFPILGEHLLEATYEPLFPYFDYIENAFKIISGDFIEEGSGTGVVHIAPGFGEDDFRIGQENNIGIVVPVDSAGKFTDEVPDYKGMNVFDANDEIIKALKTQGSWIKTEQYIHNYPHCWRTDQPLIYKALPSWYVEVTKFKDRMVELNQKINWIPEHVRDGLMGKWLEGARDWSISRNRFWGAPIPIWRSKSGKLKCVGSIDELEKLSGKRVTDLHRPFIDEVVFTIDGEEYKRVEDVLDCWFESGSMPFASQGFKGEKPEPADFIVEYTAQTRGWFYTMIVLGVALFDEIPFKNCICHGVVLDAQGQKLSKRLNNYPDPLELFNEYGSDALRWAMLSSPIMRGQELYIDKEGKFIRDVLRLYIKPIWNAFNFFTLYANADGVKAEYKTTSNNLMDKYILAKCDEAVAAIKKGMDEFDTPSAYQAVEQFFEVLNNWYIRRSKERFWKTEHDADKQAAYDTLYTILITMCRAAAPLLPLVTEEVYKTLTGEESVHLAEFPTIQQRNNATTQLIHEMDKVRDVCNAALSVRSAANIRVRQPLAKITIVGNLEWLSNYADIIKDELNVKQVEFDSEVDVYAESKLKINFPVLGKRLPEKMKQIIAAAKKNEWVWLEGGIVVVADEKLTKEECELQLVVKTNDRAALSTQDALVVLDLNLTPELVNEGLARDIVRMVQQARKDADLNVADRIDLVIETDTKIADFTNYIAEQVLAKSIKLGSASGKHVVENDLEGKKIKFGFSVVA